MEEKVIWIAARSVHLIFVENNESFVWHPHCDPFSTGGLFVLFTILHLRPSFLPGSFSVQAVQILFFFLNPLKKKRALLNGRFLIFLYTGLCWGRNVLWNPPGKKMGDAGKHQEKIREIDWAREVCAGPARPGLPSRKVDERPIQSERVRLNTIQFK